MINTTKNGETKFSKPFQELKTLVKNDGRNNDVKRISEQPKYVDKKMVGEDQKMEEYLYFFLSDNANQENILTGKKRKYGVQKLKPCNTSRIKSQTFLTSISYDGVKEEDLYNVNFIVDVHVLITKNTNLFLLERKIFDVKDRVIVSMFWDKCVDSKFYKHIFLLQNFIYLNGKNVLYPRVAEIVWKHIEYDKNNICSVRKKLIENRKIFQFAYSNTYPEVYSFVEKRAIDLRNDFHSKFKEWKDKKISKVLRAAGAT